MPLIPAFRKQKEVEHHELEAILVYRVISKKSPKLQKNPALKKQTNKRIYYLLVQIINQMAVTGFEVQLGRRVVRKRSVTTSESEKTLRVLKFRVAVCPARFRVFLSALLSIQ